MGGARVMKRIPMIKFPQRHKTSSGSAPHAQATTTAGDTNQIVMSRSNASRTPYTLAPGGKASDQLKRTPVSEEEIQAILMGGCF